MTINTNLFDKYLFKDLSYIKEFYPNFYCFLEIILIIYFYISLYLFLSLLYSEIWIF